MEKMSPQETASARDAIVNGPFVQLVGREFARRSDLPSALMLVAQYWNDEAEDAVHYGLIFSVLPRPDLNAASKHRDQDEDPINRWSYEELWQHNKAPAYVQGWDDNGRAIPLFAAFCKEDCHQEMEGYDAYTPYALFTRDGAGVKVTVVGEMLRPWLDGVVRSSASQG